MVDITETSELVTYVQMGFTPDKICHCNQCIAVSEDIRFLDNLMLKADQKS